MFASLGMLVVSMLTLSRAEHFETMYTLNYVYSSYGDGDDHVNWDEAEFKCPYYNDGHLAVIKDFTTDRDIAELVDAWPNREMWIGILDKYTSGYWFWNDGTKIDDYFQNWKSGEPNNHFGEDCGTYLTSSANWNDKDCGSRFGFVCQKERAEDNAFSHTEYVIGEPTPKNGYDGTYASAQKMCIEQGYGLADTSGSNILEELKKNSNWNPSAKYWTNRQGWCLSLDEQGLHTANCEGDIRYICEGMHSFNMRLSTTQQDYMVSDTIKIECTAVGLPSPNVTWYKRNAVVCHKAGKGSYQIVEQGKSTLVIESAKLEDAARYRCLAANSINGESRKTKTYIDLRVHPHTLTNVQDADGNTRSLLPNAAGMARSSEIYGEETKEQESRCENQHIVTWMLPTIFALNILIMLALGALICSARSAPKKAPHLEFANAVYSIAGKGAGPV